MRLCAQGFEATRGRATDAIAIIRHLQEFSVIQDLRDVPQMFHDEKRQAEAAVSSLISPKFGTGCTAPCQSLAFLET